MTENALVAVEIGVFRSLHELLVERLSHCADTAHPHAQIEDTLAILNSRVQLVVDILICARLVDIGRAARLRYSKAGYLIRVPGPAALLRAKNNILTDTYLLGTLVLKGQVQPVVGSSVGVKI